jgi:hypothetical protein
LDIIKIEIVSRKFLMGMKFLTTNSFWTKPPSGESLNPSDPLGLDSMRTQIANKLVPCLTGRVTRHEDFFWTLCFIEWASHEKEEKSRVESFLQYERLLKLWWAKQGLTGFSGTNEAHDQVQKSGEPKINGLPLLRHQRAQGLLGAHLGPLREMGLVQSGAIELEECGKHSLGGIDEGLAQFKEGDWNSLDRVLRRTKQHFTTRFENSIRESLSAKMPELNFALSKTGWIVEPHKWYAAARHLGALNRYAKLANEFCRWAKKVREVFDQVLNNNGHMPRGVSLPQRLKSGIPTDPEFFAFEPLKKALANWKCDGPGAVRMLAKLHSDVFKSPSRGYGDVDLWLLWEDNRPLVRKHLLPINESNSSGDCRWSNAVLLMRPHGNK